MDTHGAGTAPAVAVPGSPTEDEVHIPDAHDSPPSRTGWLWILLTAGLAWPWLLTRFLTDYHHHPPALNALLTGIAILAAAFILSWAAEVFQLDVSQAFALSLLALIAVLPEYAVDAVFAWRAASDPTQAPYAVANMTGSNRLLIGVGWSSVVLLAWWRMRRRQTGHPVGGPPAAPSEVVGGTVLLQPGQALELAALGAATVYSFFIPLKGGIGMLDTVILVTLFGIYSWATAKLPAEHPHLVGPAATVGVLPVAARRAVTYGMFAYAAIVIFSSAEPFAEGLVQSGTALGIDEFLLVQWLAPLASESPEFLVALLFAWRGLAGAGLRTLVASKVNQWTLLIGTLPLAYSIAKGFPDTLPLDARQTEELFLTSAQSLFALALIANFNMTVREAILLLATFAVQPFFPQREVRLFFAAVYLVVGIALMVATPSRRRSLLRVPQMIREAMDGTPPAQPVPAPSVG